jgi:hypothetical protein
VDGDNVDQAIARAETNVEMIHIPVVVNATGRPFSVDVPVDMTELELIAMVGWITNALVNVVAQNRAKKSSPIVVVRGGKVQ